MTIAATAGVGGKRVLRLAREWTGNGVVAAALIRRVAVIVTPVERVRDRIDCDPGADLAFPNDMLLILDDAGTLHLVGMGGFWQARPRQTLRRWPPGTAAATVGHGQGWFRPLTILDGNGATRVAAPYVDPRQKDALAMIERLTL
jgi:hypothetical protein